MDAFKPFTIRQCSGWCVEVTFLGTPSGALATHLVVNVGDNERLAAQIADDCNTAAAQARLDTERFSYLKEREKEVLAELVRIKGMSAEAVMRHALRMHQFVDKYLRMDMELCFRKPDGEIVRPFYHGPKKAPYVEDNRS
jgi:hypothetical protein